MFSKSKTKVNRFNEACLIGAIGKYSGNYIGVHIAFLNDARLRRRGSGGDSKRAWARTFGVRIWQRSFQHQHLGHGRTHRPPPNARAETRSQRKWGAATGEVD
ncbi:hypothetical protein [Burkholderia cepacia]|uniref:hypothetical protein n=1 Tax=Burkholderia cepacia TaxID=292 RepID=UPI000A416E12|nr:hypothetical protein [Burkholderia cepacia]